MAAQRVNEYIINPKTTDSIIILLHKHHTWPYIYGSRCLGIN